MTYYITKSDLASSNPNITIPEGIIDSHRYSLSMVGQGVSDYGQYFNENFIRLLENFASTSAPQPQELLVGQLWYDTHKHIMRVWDGANWKSSTGVSMEDSLDDIDQVGTLVPPQTGSMYFNREDKKLYVYDDVLAMPWATSYAGEVSAMFSNHTDMGSPINYGTRFRNIYLRTQDATKYRSVAAITFVNDGILNTASTKTRYGRETIMAIFSAHPEPLAIPASGNSISEGEHIDYCDELLSPGGIAHRNGGKILPGLNMANHPHIASVPLSDHAKVSDIALSLGYRSDPSDDELTYVRAQDLYNNKSHVLPELDGDLALGQEARRFNRSHVKFMATDEIWADSAHTMGESYVSVPQGDFHGNWIFNHDVGVLGDISIAGTTTLTDLTLNGCLNTNCINSVTEATLNGNWNLESDSHFKFSGTTEFVGSQSNHGFTTYHGPASFRDSVNIEPSASLSVQADANFSGRETHRGPVMFTNDVTLSGGGTLRLEQGTTLNVRGEAVFLDDVVYHGVVTYENDIIFRGQTHLSGAVSLDDGSLDVSSLSDIQGLIPRDVAQLTDATGVIPTDVSDLTDTNGIIPRDASDLTDTGGVIPTSLLDLGIVDGEEGYILTTDGQANFRFAQAPPMNLRDLEDVTAPRLGTSYAELSVGNVLMFNGEFWEPKPVGEVSGGGGGATTLSQLVDVTGTPSAGQVLKYNGSTWTPAEDLTGTTATGDIQGPNSSQNQEIVVYSGTTGKQIGNSNKMLPTGQVVGTDDVQTLSNKVFSDHVGINGNTDATHALKVTGSILATGDVWGFSDQRLKTDVATLNGDVVYGMRGVSYMKDGNPGSGVIAQELEMVAPELVNSQGEFKSVAYGNLVGYLIEAIKDLKAEVQGLKTQIQELKEQS